MTRRRAQFCHRLVAACVPGLMAAAACLSNASGAQDSPAIQIRDAWVRWLPGNLPAGGYVTLVNSGDRPVSLIAASSPDYALVSMHRSRTTAGVSQMLPVNKITVAAHSSVEFGAQGYHLMLEHPTRALRPGDQVSVRLQFAGSPAVTATLTVREPAAGTEMPDMPGMPDMKH
jgi:periplasmic copper chaperone A